MKAVSESMLNVGLITTAFIAYVLGSLHIAFWCAVGWGGYLFVGHLIAAKTYRVLEEIIDDLEKRKVKAA